MDDYDYCIVCDCVHRTPICKLEETTKNKTGYVGVCSFKREEDSEVEMGFLINENVVIDLDGKIPEEVWMYIFFPHLGCFQISE